MSSPWLLLRFFMSSFSSFILIPTSALLLIRIIFCFSARMWWWGFGVLVGVGWWENFVGGEPRKPFHLIRKGISVHVALVVFFRVMFSVATNKRFIFLDIFKCGINAEKPSPWKEKSHLKIIPKILTLPHLSHASSPTYPDTSNMFCIPSGFTYCRQIRYFTNLHQSQRDNLTLFT